MSALGAYRTLLVLLGLAAGVLLVRALDAGLSGESRSLSVGHAALGVVLGAAVMPGALLGYAVGPRSSDRLRGLAVGGTAVTALAALVGGALLWNRVFGDRPAGATEVTALAWCAAALPLCLIDWLRLRIGGALPGGEP